MLYTFFYKKSAKGSGVTTLASNSAIKSIQIQQLANKLHKPIIRKFKKPKVYSLFKENICE